MTQEITLERARTHGPQPDLEQDARVAALEAEVAVLEAELERRDRRHEQVVDRYETLLAEQTRSHRESGQFVWTGGGSIDDQGGPLSALLSLF